MEGGATRLTGAHARARAPMRFLEGGNYGGPQARSPVRPAGKPAGREKYILKGVECRVQSVEDRV